MATSGTANTGSGGGASLWSDKPGSGGSGIVIVRYPYSGPGGSPYDTWAGSAVFTDDANGDGVANGLAWILGAAGPSDHVVLPAPGTETGFLTLHFARVPDQGPAKLYVEYSNDLSTWSTPVEIPAGSDTVGGDIEVVVIPASPPGVPNDDVTVKIPTSHASGAGKLFGRLMATEN
ncbi:MAG: hypothetical protein NTW21_28530 [Verrucomicrobia bacterium]|nr:hypothetical protein [Verrucomicrobiota bacterium]